MLNTRRIAVLFSRLSGYMAACLKALKHEYGVKLLVYRWRPSSNAPFEERHFESIDALHTKQDETNAELAETVHRFAPHGILMAGWMDRDYLQVARQIRRDGVPVVAGCDTQWSGSLRQRVGQLTAPWYLHSAVDVLWVAGERQRQLAHRLGFRGRRCWSGYYACDWQRFAEGGINRSKEEDPAFLFVGRYVKEKGVDTLVRAYRRYRAEVDTPWPLVCVGAGELQPLLTGQEGIINKGFIQPDRLPALMCEASVFVLPSQQEPWGVVLQEAAASGLPLICSDACGAAVHLLQDGYNGFTIGTDDVQHLSECLQRMSAMGQANRADMGRRSYELSKQYTPQRWARTLVEGIQRLRESK